MGAAKFERMLEKSFAMAVAATPSTPPLPAPTTSTQAEPSQGILCMQLKAEEARYGGSGGEGNMLPALLGQSQQVSYAPEIGC